MTEQREKRPAAYLYLDLETTGLDPERDVVTQAAWIIGGEERDYHICYSGFPTMWSARNTSAWYYTEHATSSQLAFGHLFEDCLRASKDADLYLVGAVPSFDDGFLRKVFREVPYRYTLVCVNTLVMGALGLDRPPHLHECRELLGIAGENEHPHDALYDAREAKLIFEAVMARQSNRSR